MMDVSFLTFIYTHTHTHTHTLRTHTIFEENLTQEITRLSSEYSAGLNTHPNHLVTQLSNSSAFWRLRKLLPSDLPYRFTETT
jgi:hypothetical protein